MLSRHWVKIKHPVLTLPTDMNQKRLQNLITWILPTALCCWWILRPHCKHVGSDVMIPSWCTWMYLYTHIRNIKFCRFCIYEGIYIYIGKHGVTYGTKDIRKTKSEYLFMIFRSQVVSRWKLGNITIFSTSQISGHIFMEEEALER